jgi:hypothetical protein
MALKARQSYAACTAGSGGATRTVATSCSSNLIVVLASTLFGTKTTMRFRKSMIVPEGASYPYLRRIEGQPDRKYLVEDDGRIPINPDLPPLVYPWVYSASPSDDPRA